MVTFPLHHLSGPLPLGPAGVFDSYLAYSIGVRSQAAKASLTEDIPKLEAEGADLRVLLGIVMKALMKTSKSMIDHLDLVLMR